MKKKTVKKLVLAKETVRELKEGLQSVQGGKPPTTIELSCFCESETEYYCG